MWALHLFHLELPFWSLGTCWISRWGEDVRWRDFAIGLYNQLFAGIDILMNRWNLWIVVTTTFIACGLSTTHILTWSIISWSFDNNLCWSCQFFMACRVVKIVIYIFKIGFCKQVMCLDLHVDILCSHIGHQQFIHNNYQFMFEKIVTARVLFDEMTWCHQSGLYYNKCSKSKTFLLWSLSSDYIKSNHWLWYTYLS